MLIQNEKIDDYVKTMSEATRMRMLEIIDDVEGVLPHLYYLYTHFPRYRLEAALHYLATNKIRGAKFIEFWRSLGESDLEVHRYLIKALERIKGERTLIMGKDVAL